MLRAILFDMGGTLDGDGHWLDRFAALYAAQHFSLSRDAIRRGFDYAEGRAAGDEGIVTAGITRLVRSHVAWQFEAHRLEHDPRGEAIAEAFIGSVRAAARTNVRLLESLYRHGLALAVVSNACGNAQALCDDLGYAPFLSAVIDSRVAGVAKPDPRIFTRALEALDVDAGAALMVGDSYERDIVPAHHLGLATAWLVPSGVPPDRGVAGRCVPSLAALVADLVPAVQETA